MKSEGKKLKIAAVKIRPETEFDPKTMTAVKVFIKTEGHERGQMVGPVWVEIEGKKVKTSWGELQKPTVNYKTDNGWNWKPAVWYTYTQALKIAKELGVKLETC